MLHHYLIVGLTERVRDFLAVQLYQEGHKSHLRRTTKQIQPSEETVEKIHRSNTWKMENEFYEFVQDHFLYLRHLTFEELGGQLLERNRKFPSPLMTSPSHISPMRYL